LFFIRSARERQSMRNHHQTLSTILFLLFSAVVCAADTPAKKTFKAGAYAINVSPLKFPVIINGGMTERTADKITDPLHARCLVLDDGKTKVAIVVVDSCMMPRDLLDEAKEMASRATGIPASRMLISATHTHSAPSVHGCLGSDKDEEYASFLAPQIAKGIVEANSRLQPARIGWAFGKDEKNVACRHWVMKPGTAATNPFGGTKDDVAQMNPNVNNPNAIRPTGKPDPAVPVVSIQTLDGKPLVIYSAYSLHYVGKTTPVSADYFGVYCEEMAKRLKGDSSFMAALANATSGDTWLMDYSQPVRREYTLESVASDVADAAMEAYRRIEYYDWAPIVMEESLLECGVRMPSEDEVAAAKEFMKSFKGRKPKNVPEVYARETVLLSQMPPTRELKIQALRIGPLGIGTIPNETYGSTGLYIKEHSPLKETFVVELANGCEGYIPPPELHPLGGYTCWRARTACLEPQAERKIRDRVLELLASVSKQRDGEEPVKSK
jgi:neutral ceramidase